MIKKVISILGEYKVVYNDEKSLQATLERLFTEKQLKFRREVRLNDKDIADFLFDDGLLVEVKLKGSTSDLIRQLFRYAQHEQVKTILVVTSRNKLAALPEEINGKLIVAYVLRFM